MNKKFIKQKNISLLLLLIIIFIMIFLTGCNSNERNSYGKTMDVILKEFYNAEYDYTITASQNKNDNSVTSMTTKGQLHINPYKEHIEIISPEIPINLPSEYFYKMKFGLPFLYFMKTDITKSQIIFERPRPHGYGQNIIFTKKEQVKLHDENVLVYSGNYSIDLSKIYSQSEDLSATIYQQYYVSETTHQIIRIITDLSEQSKMTNIANNMHNNGMSRQKAEASIKESNYVSIQTLDIYNYGNATDFDIPE